MKDATPTRLQSAGGVNSRNPQASRNLGRMFGRPEIGFWSHDQTSGHGRQAAMNGLSQMYQGDGHLSGENGSLNLKLNRYLDYSKTMR